MSRYKIAIKDSKKGEGQATSIKPAKNTVECVVKSLDACATEGDSLDASGLSQDVLYKALNLYSRYRNIPVLVNSESDCMILKLSYKVNAHSLNSLPKSARTVIAIEVTKFPSQVNQVLTVINTTPLKV